MARPTGGLGKGLSSLIPPGESDVDAPDEGAVLRDLAVAEITPNPNQPRVHFDEESLAELTASVQQIGVLQPILVRAVDTGFELIAGERRWRAARRAGLATIPAVIRQGDDLASVEQALVENLHRQDLTALEEAAAYQQLIEDFELTHEQVADRVGKSRSAVTNILRLLGLPPSIQHLLADGRLSAGHARALLGTPDRTLQEELARRAADEGWTVRMVEEAVKHGGLPTPSVGDEGTSAIDDGGADGAATPVPSQDGAGITPATRLRPPGLLELEGLLAEHLDTRVAVQMGAKKGRIAIDFADLDDLERIYRRMTGEPD